MALLLFLFIFLDPFLTIFPSLAANCPDLMDGQMLDFANPGAIRLHKSVNGGCHQMLTCDVISAPAETIVEWLYNGEVFRTNSAGELAYLLAKDEGKGQLGLSETSHRLCASDLFKGNNTSLDGALGCRIRLSCDPSKFIESEPLALAKLASFLPKHRAERAIIVKPKRRPQAKAPSIYLVTSSRMEMAGHVLHIMCRANGDPKPKLGWTVFAMDGTEFESELPAKDFAFITSLNNGDLLVDTSLDENALTSLSFRCHANNRYGEDSATSTIILLKE